MNKDKLVEFISRVLGHSQREDVLKFLPKNSIGAEIGVFKGEFSKYILKIIQPQEVFFIDCWWTKYGDHFPNWGKYTNNGTLKTKEAYQNLLKVINKFDRNKVSRVLVGDDLEILNKFPDSYFDWVYLDSSHEYEHTKKEFIILKEKVKTGGSISGHDWTTNESNIHFGVTIAIKEFCQKYNWKIIYIDKFSNWILKKGI